MSYKPDESAWMAYLYDELSGNEKLMMDKYLQENPGALKEFQELMNLRNILSTVKDKEVIAPPIVMEDATQRFFWNAPYFNTVMSIAAALLLLMVAGKIMDVRVNYSNHEMRIGFGPAPVTQVPEQTLQANLTPEQVQNMINATMQQNNTVVEASLSYSRKKIDESIRKNLAVTSGKINALVEKASQASENEISRYVASLQNENQQMVKNYFQLSTTEQQKYIENLLVDFAKYMNQQHNNDLEVLQARLLNVEQNTTVFKEETQQILSSIISNTNTPVNKGKSY